MAIEMEMEMDLGTPVMTRTRTPDSDTDTPPRSTPTKRLHYSNDRHAPGVSYKECMKNHAATIGGHALDGCCEFMPGPTFNLLDPTSLKCGACGCHRNFHRRDPDDPAPLNHHPTPARRAHSPPSASQLLLSLSQSPSGPSDEVNPTAVSLGGGACGGGSGGGVLVGFNGGQNGNFSSSSSRKRFRTKFSQEQKEKMYEFSEKIGWKLKKGEENLIEDFVKEIGVGRTVFKVWMHNNKHTSSSSTSKTRGGEHNNSNNHNLNNNLVEEANVIAPTTTTTTTTTAGYVQQLQQHSTSNGSKSGSSGHVGNCGASVVDHVNHSVNNHHHHHNRQFNFANGGGQEAAQAQ